MRKDYNKYLTPNMPELHIFLNELFPSSVSKGSPPMYNALKTMNANCDKQIKQLKIYNLSRYMIQFGYQSITISFDNYRYAESE
jgi:hypothetical protein